MLSKERLLELGIEDEKAEKILEEVNKDYVPNYRYKEVKDNLDSLNEDIKKRDKQIEGLKKHTGNKEELEAEINKLKEENKKDREAAEGKLSAIRKDNAITEYLYGQKVNNISVVRKLLDADNIKYEDNKLIGIDEQLKTLKEDETLKSLFKETKMTGANPRIPGDNPEKPKGLFDVVIGREVDNKDFNPWG
ncbi:phage scaffolding protein [Peptoniphilus sp. SGI.035]|uniref:phage scaffolding protein n=1 Tax=Peptoniphilus sp. SGI.035 TaxID=3420564 RepID=UPI003D047774